MKNKTLYLLSIAALGSATMFSACSKDFLETESKTTSNSQTAFSDVATAEQALYGCYDGWQRTLSDEGVGIYMASEFASDECFAGSGVGDARNYNIIDEFDLSQAPSYTDLFNQDWMNYYKAIYRCNTLLVNEENIDWGTDEVGHKRIIGECKGLRALLYFDLTRLFGDVPLITEPTEDDVERTAASKVFELIFDDLKYAAENIPGDSYNGTTFSSSDGRMSKYAAEALLARAYMFYSGYYGEEPSNCTKADAVAALEDVIDNGKYKLAENYADLWMPACSTPTDNNGDKNYGWKSTYLGKYYDGTAWKTNDQGNTEFILQLKCNSTHDYNGNGDGNTFQVFLGNRGINHAPYAYGWGICVPNPNFVGKFGGTCLNAGVVNYKTSGLESESDFTNKVLRDSYEYTGYGIKKYAPMCMNDGTREAEAFKLGEQHMNITYYLDYCVVRYADVVLMAKELGSAKTDNDFATLCTRGGYSAGDDMLDIRAREFCFEGIRYWDLLRQGVDKAAQILQENQLGAPIKNGGVDASFSFNAANFTAKKGLMQIPYTQLSLSQKLKQNEGWQ